MIPIKTLAELCQVTINKLYSDFLSLGINKQELEIGECLLVIVKNLLEKTGMPDIFILPILHEFRSNVLKFGQILLDVGTRGDKLGNYSLEILDGRFVTVTDCEYFFDVVELAKRNKLDNLPCTSYTILLTGVFLQLIGLNHENEGERRDRY